MPWALCHAHYPAGERIAVAMEGSASCLHELPSRTLYCHVMINFLSDWCVSAGIDTEVEQNSIKNKAAVL